MQWGLAHVLRRGDSLGERVGMALKFRQLEPVQNEVKRSKVVCVFLEPMLNRNQLLLQVCPLVFWGREGNSIRKLICGCLDSTGQKVVCTGQRIEGRQSEEGTAEI